MNLRSTTSILSNYGWALFVWALNQLVSTLLVLLLSVDLSTSASFRLPVSCRIGPWSAIWPTVNSPSRVHAGRSPDKDPSCLFVRRLTNGECLRTLVSANPPIVTASLLGT
jgi:hypothetical protein